MVCVCARACACEFHWCGCVTGFQNFPLAAHLIWMIGEFLPLGISSSSSAVSTVSDGQLDFVETLETVVYSAIFSARQTDAPTRDSSWAVGEGEGEGGSRLDQLACQALSSLSKMATRFAAVSARVQLLLGKVVVARGCSGVVRQRAIECLGLLRQPSVASAAYLPSTAAASAASTAALLA
jgi:hypothetical protein